jgi:hypothetical protein
MRVTRCPSLRGTTVKLMVDRPTPGTPSEMSGGLCRGANRLLQQGADGSRFERLPLRRGRQWRISSGFHSLPNSRGLCDNHCKLLPIRQDPP